ncbi:hypothetical protein HY375_00165 [Candidatus Berkelbacteria bacterium]|nr:hypothetical protein [Candidatus Berkelbacteria bacterium]
MPTSHLLPGAGALLDQAWQTWCRSLRPLFWLLFLPSILSLSGTFVAKTGVGGVTNLEEGIGNLLILGAWLVSFAALLVAIDLLVADEGAPALATRARRALRRYWPFVGLNLVLLAAIFAGAFLFAIPAIIFLVWWVFAPFVFTAEQTRVFASLGHSKLLSAGRWWAVFGRLLVLGLVVTGISILAVLVLAVLGLDESIFRMGQVPPYTTERFLVQLALNGLSALTTAFSLAYIWRLYRALAKGA